MKKTILSAAALAAALVFLPALAGAAAPVKVWDKTVSYVDPFAPFDGATVADLDGDDVCEVLVASGRQCHVWRNDGAVYPGFPKEITAPVTCFQNAPAVGDLDGDDDVEIVVGARGFTPGRGGTLFAWHHDGTAVNGFPIEGYYGATPVLEDMDGDGADEIIICEHAEEFDYLHVIDGQGRELTGWPRETSERFGNAPAVGDVDRDGRPEVLVFGRDVPDQNKLFAWNDDGSVLAGFPFAFTYPDSPVSTGAPALADFDRDGRLEIAFGTMSGGAYEISYFYVVRANGRLAPGWPKEVERIRGTAGAADIDNDGFLEIIAREFNDGRVLVWNYDGSYVAGFPVRPGGYANVAVGDVDDDGCLEIVAGSKYKNLWAFNHNGSVVDGFPITLKGGNNCSIGLCSPAIWDLDGDRNLELVIVSHSIVELSATYVEVFEVERGGHSVVWPMHNHDRRHTSCYDTKLGGVGIALDYFCAQAEGEDTLVRWATSSEWDHAGFNLYRASGDAVKSKLNADLITGRTPYRYVDNAVEAGEEYRYWLEAVELSGAKETFGPIVCIAGGKAKAAFALSQNRPNPARDSTTVAFSVPAACEATVTVYDVAGRKVAVPFAGMAKAGENEVPLDVSNLAPGVYAYRLEAAGATAAKRMVVIK